MSPSALPPMRVPTLTEVVDWPPAQLIVVEQPASPPSEAPIDLPNESPNEPKSMPSDVAAGDAPTHSSVLTPPIDETVLTQRLLTDLQHHVDALLEQQLQAAMQPLLNRLADTLAQQAREELASALRDMVALAVSREMIRLRAAAPHSDPAEP